MTDTVATTPLALQLETVPPTPKHKHHPLCLPLADITLPLLVDRRSPRNEVLLRVVARMVVRHVAVVDTHIVVVVAADAEGTAAAVVVAVAEARTAVEAAEGTTVAAAAARRAAAPPARRGGNGRRRSSPLRKASPSNLVSVIFGKY